MPPTEHELTEPEPTEPEPTGHERDAAAARASALAGELRAVLGTLKRRLREQSQPGDLTSSQISALLRLEQDGPATVTALARAEGVRPQSMGATISALEAAGLVHGAPDPNDGRQTILSLTPMCREWIAAVRAAGEDWLFRAIRTNLAAHELDQLASAIALLKRLVGS
jgi:DNA-binding MarR family transcriptional regulator